MAQQFGVEGEEFRQLKVRKDLLDPPIAEIGFE